MRSFASRADSPINLLPTEIFSLILQYACPPLDLSQRYGIDNPYMRKPEELRSQFTLSAVSARWREATFSTPQLWTSVDVAVKSDQASEILQIFFAGSGGLPIAIALHFDNSEQGHTIILPSFLQHTHRIQELHLDNPPETWTSVLASPRDSFVRLSINRPQTSKDLFFDVSCTYLALRFIAKRVNLRWMTITILHLFEFSEVICLELLKECVNLIEFRNRAPIAYETDEAPLLPSRPFILPHLKTFEWSLCFVSNVDNIMLRNVRMPVLETLVWLEEGDWDPDEDDEDLDDPSNPRSIFFTCLPSTLRILYLGDFKNAFEYHTIVRSLGRIFNVEHLVIPGFYEASLEPLVEALTINTENKTLPKLKTIVLHICARFSDPFLRVDLDALLLMLESRLSYWAQTDPQQSMRLEIKIHSGRVDFLPAFREGMKALVQRGLDLEITGESTLLE